MGFLFEKYVVTEHYRDYDEELTGDYLIAEFVFETDAREYVDFMNAKYYTNRSGKGYSYKKVDC